MGDGLPVQAIRTDMAGQTAVLKKAYNIIRGLCHRTARLEEEEEEKVGNWAVVCRCRSHMLLSRLALCRDGQSGQTSLRSGFISVLR